MSAKAKRNLKEQGFKPGEFIVYPSHGVGIIKEAVEEEIAGNSLQMAVIDFELNKTKMKLRVPIEKISKVGMRKISNTALISKSLETLQGRARVKRTMWSRRAQEYEAKINSGDLMLVAEVVRDLFRGENKAEQSYSERQIYESALDRMSREVAAAKNVSNNLAVEEIENYLNSRRRAKAKAATAKDNSSAQTGQEKNSSAQAGQESNSNEQAGKKNNSSAQTGQEKNSSAQAGQESNSNEQAGQEKNSSAQAGQESNSNAQASQEKAA